MIKLKDIYNELKGCSLYDSISYNITGDDADATIQGFPSCCGAVILHGMSYKACRVFTEPLLKVLEYNNINEGFGVVYAITSETQVDLENDFRENKYWRKIDLMANPNNGNELTTWILRL